MAYDPRLVEVQRLLESAKTENNRNGQTVFATRLVVNSLIVLLFVVLELLKELKKHNERI